MKRFDRVFALVPDCHGEPTRYSSLWRRHFYDGLRGAVPTLILPVDVDFGWARPVQDAPRGPSPERAAVSERMWTQIRDARPDVVISCCFASDLEVGLVKRTVEAGVPWINFYCDGVYAFDRVVSLARAVSLNWFPECEIEERYRGLGRPWICRPYALNPDALTESVCETALYPIGFVGAALGNRVLGMVALRLLGCPVTVRGHGWQRAPQRAPREGRRGLSSFLDRRSRGRLGERALVRLLRPLIPVGGPLSDDDLPRFVATCRMVLGLNAGRDRRGRYQSYLKSRDVEFPGYGACYVTQHNEGVAKAFDVGREILTFRNVAEVVSLAREYTAAPERARAIGRAGRRRVLAHHTWAARLGELAAAL